MEQQTAKILAVEDDIFLKELLAGRFSGGDFNILHASDGDEALQLAQEEKPNIILLDIILPGMSGFEVIQKLKENPETADIPVIFLSNLGSEDDVKKGKELGAIDFLIKANNSLDAIVDRIREAVEEQGAGAAEGTAPAQEGESQPAAQDTQSQPEPEPQPQPQQQESPEQQPEGPGGDSPEPPRQF